RARRDRGRDLVLRASQSVGTRLRRGRRTVGGRDGTAGWRRVSAHRARWELRLAPHGRIRKRGEVDKEGVEMWVPMSESARRAVAALLEHTPAIGDTPLFPAPEGRAKGRKRRRPKSWSRWHARDLHERAQRAAGYGYS